MSGRQLQEDPLLIRGTQESGRGGVVSGDRGLLPRLQWKSLEDPVEGDVISPMGCPGESHVLEGVCPP